MQNWKMAMVAGSITASAILLVRGKRTAGIAAAGVGAVVLASEYPEKLEEIRDRLPEYAERGVRILENLAQAGERFAQLVEKRAPAALGGVRPY